MRADRGYARLVPACASGGWSIADEAEPLIREQLALCATMPATVVAERIGWERSDHGAAGEGGAAAAFVPARRIRCRGRRMSRASGCRMILVSAC